MKVEPGKLECRFCAASLERVFVDLGTSPLANSYLEPEDLLRPETFYPLRLALPPLGRFFAESRWYERLAELDPDPPDPAGVGIHHARPDPESERGGFWLYVPERYPNDRDWPLGVALHGRSRPGRAALWAARGAFARRRQPRGRRAAADR